jgi:hypothetical protein
MNVHLDETIEIDLENEMAIDTTVETGMMADAIIRDETG